MTDVDGLWLVENEELTGVPSQPNAFRMISVTQNLIGDRPVREVHDVVVGALRRDRVLQDRLERIGNMEFGFRTTPQIISVAKVLHGQVVGHELIQAEGKPVISFFELLHGVGIKSDRTLAVDPHLTANDSRGGHFRVGDIGGEEQDDPA